MNGPNLSGYTVEAPKQPIGFTAQPQRLVIVRANNTASNDAQGEECK